MSTQLGSRVDYYKANSKRKAAPTYHVSLFRTLPGTDLLVKGTYKTGFKLPSIYQKYDATSGNEALEAEESETRELSLSTQIKKLELSTVFFDTSLTNKIAWTSKYHNIQESTYRGTEYAVQVRQWGVFDFLRLDYTELNAVDDNKPAKKVPDYKYSVSTGINHNKWSYGIFLVGESGKNEGAHGSAYNYTDVSVTYDYNQKTSLFTKVHNLFDVDYETAKGYNEAGATLFFGLKRQL